MGVKNTFFGLLLILLASQTAAAAIIAQWDYNDRSTVVDVGAGTQYTVGHFLLTGFDHSSDPNDPALNRVDDRYWVASFNYGTDVGKGLAWAVSTAGYQNIKFSLDIMPGVFAPDTWKWQYSTNGGTSWTDAGTQSVARTMWSTIDLDLSSIGGVTDNSAFLVRLLSAEDGAGFVSFDWVTASGTVYQAAPVPVPAPVLLLASGLAGLVALKHRSWGKKD